uniref:Uncharacterized protein n=1 Tax=Schizaphis graminum TaxID=13262 RepID=A0A2S2P196_SCHGA
METVSDHGSHVCHRHVILVLVSVSSVCGGNNFSIFFFYITHVAFDLFRIICYGYSFLWYNVRQIDKLIPIQCMILLYYTVSCNEGDFYGRHRLCSSISHTHTSSRWHTFDSQ